MHRIGHIMNKKWREEVAKKAHIIFENPETFPTVIGMEIDEIFSLLLSLEEDKIERDKLTDDLQEYNDEIVSIEYIGEQECMDISVSGDNLFYANNILTKNSFGLPATADLMFAIMQSPEEEEQNIVSFKQLKNRGNDVSYHRRFVTGVNKAKMRFFDTDQQIGESNTEDAGTRDPDTPVFDKGIFANRSTKDDKMRIMTGKKDYSALT